jgi:hypothetical protein
VETRTQTKAPFWETDVEDGEGGLWRVRTQDLQYEPLQMPSEMVKAIIGNRGQFQTTVYGPDGGQYKNTFCYTRAEAEEFHERMVDRIRTGTL